MEYTILSLNALPFLLPIIISVIILNVGLYAHLNFKHISIKPISGLAALLMIPLAVFYVPLVSKMAFNFNFLLINIHLAFLGFAFIGVLIFAAITPKRPPGIKQLIGLLLFLFAFYSLLA